MNLTKLKELCEKASPEPWTYSGADEMLFTYPKYKKDGAVLDVDISVGNVDNAEFIAQARTALPILIEVVERQREAIYEACNLEAYIESEDGEYWVKSFNQRVKECDELLKELE